jgi:GLPGLI family protein
MKYLFFLLFVFVGIKTEAQRSFFPKGPRDIFAAETVDSGNIRIYYTLNKYQNVEKKNKRYASPIDSIWFACNDCEEDIHILEIGKKLSKYYSYNVFIGDSIFSYFMKKNPNATGAPHRSGRNPTVSNKYFWSELYKDYAKNTLTEYAYMPVQIPNYCYTEEIPDFAWEIQEDTLTVANYLCQKATYMFRGYNYIAWFTPDIPINNGPWKFSGLPGLILKIYDEHDKHVFECTRIETNKNGFAITSYDYKNYKNITREKLLKLWENIFDHYEQMVEYVRISGNYYPKKIPYNPLELE